jgi:hypothetical protein
MSDPAWFEGCSDWRTVAEIPGLFESAPPALPVKAQVVAKKINRYGSVCPNCGNRYSVRKSDGAGCLIVGILFVSIIGILFIPFLPKSWHCKSCGNIWK